MNEREVAETLRRERRARMLEEYETDRAVREGRAPEPQWLARLPTSQLIENLSKQANAAPIGQGFYADFSAEKYHADPCPTPSLSAGMINDLLKAPKLAWHNSSRLNPDWKESEDRDKFSIGTVAHVMHLEPEMFAEKVFIVNADDYRQKDVRLIRDMAISEGKTPILAKHMGEVMRARTAFLENNFIKEAFTGGMREISCFWKHPKYGFWCRARADFIADDYSYIADYKATGNADPNEFGAHAYRMGYHRRAAWYMEGVQTLLGIRPSHYWFCNQETKAPYLSAVTELDWSALEAGQAQNDRAAEIFFGCLSSGNWYGYRTRAFPDQDRAFKRGLPKWAYLEMEG